MGTFELVCAGSGLAIFAEEVALVLVAKEGEEWAPVAPPVRRKYDGYGSIEGIVLDRAAKGVLAGFVALDAEQGLHLPYGPWDLSGDDQSKLRELLEHVRQGLLLAPVLAADAPSPFVTAHGLPLGFVVFYAPFYKAVVKLASAAAPSLVERLELCPFDARVEAALGAPVVARALADDNLVTDMALLDLALFRTWFDARGSWSADYEAGQFSGAERRAKIEAARARLAQWPALLATIDEYELESLVVDD